MRLLPRERDRLEVFLAAELARRRRARGLRLTQAEAVALIADETLEAARDGLGYAEVERRGYGVLGPDDVLDGVAEAVDRIELEPLFADGTRLVVLLDPIRRTQAAPLDGAAAPALTWLDGAEPLAIANEGDVPVAITSHFHVFEVNRALRLDRRAAWGMRLALPPGAKLVVDPGETVAARVVPFGGRRVVRGHAGLVDGPLDAPGALEAALALARERGYRGA
jgi:urease subunit gamma/beta